MVMCAEILGVDVEQFFSICAHLRGKRVGVFGHLRADADSLGAQVAMCEILNKHHADAYIVSEDGNIPSNLQWMVFEQEIIHPECIDFDDIVLVDCGNRGRAGSYAKAYPRRPVIMVDHHITNDLFAEYNYSYSTAAATCEILTEIICAYNFPISIACASALYGGIVADTGKFSYTMTTPKTLKLSAQLIEYGANPNAIFKYIYQQESPEKMALLQRFLGNLHFYCDGNVCIGVVSNEDYALTGTNAEYTDGFVNFPRSISGVQVAALVYDRDDTTRVSLRCDDPALRLDLFAEKYHGGGHACASAFTLVGPYERFEKLLINSLQEHLNLFSK